MGEGDSLLGSLRPWGQLVNATADITERAAVLTLVKATQRKQEGGEWYFTASLIANAGSALRLLRAEWITPEEQVRGADLLTRVEQGDLERHVELIERYEANGISCLTVLDETYPQNLRKIYNKPPFLFVKGQLSNDDRRAIAIVGTRKASPEGIRRADKLARELAYRGVTVLSGLALGIDTAAHRATLEAGGRTVAVIGTGIDRIYPKENAQLAERIVESGALVSQFWPDAPPTRYSFPMRNVVMSGMSIGSVVIEASYTSGAKMQARLAHEHGKRLFLIRSLVMQEAWAQSYVDKKGAIIVDTVDDVLRVVDASEELGSADLMVAEERERGQLNLFE